MALEVLEQELKSTIIDIVASDTERASRVKEQLIGFPRCTAKSGEPVSTFETIQGQELEDVITSKQFTVHIADFVQCVTGTSTGSILAATIATAGAGVGNSGFLTTDTGMKQLYAVRRQKGFAIGSQRFSGRVMLKQISQKLHRARSTFWTSALTQSQGTDEHLQVKQEEDDRNLAAKRIAPPCWDSSAAATDVYLAKAKTIFNGWPSISIRPGHWMATTMSLWAHIPGLGPLRNLTNPSHSLSGLTAVLKQCFAKKQDDTTKWLRLSDGLKTSLVIPAFELKSRLEVNSSHDSDQRSRKTSTILKSDCYGEPITEHAAPMRDSEVRGNRPVLFYYNKVGETGAEACIGAHKDDQYGIATTNRAFCYNHIADDRHNDPDEKTSADWEHQLRWQELIDFELYQIVRASCAAPTFFPAAVVRESGYHTSRNGLEVQYRGKLVDGAMVANNPTLAGLSFMVDKQKVSLQDIAIMSLGTGIAQTACMKTSRRGSVAWAKDAVKALMGSAPELNEAIVESLYYVGQDNYRNRKLQLYQYTRINIIEHPVKLNMLGTWAEKANLKPYQCREVLHSLDQPSRVGHLQSMGSVMAEKYRTHIRAFVEDFMFSKREDLNHPKMSELWKLKQRSLKSHPSLSNTQQLRRLTRQLSRSAHSETSQSAAEDSENSPSDIVTPQPSETTAGSLRQD